MNIIDIYVELGKMPLWGSEWTSENLLDNMSKNNIQGSVVCSTSACVDFEKANEDVFNLIKSNPRFLGVLSVNLDYYNESCKQLRKYLVNKNFIAIKLFSSKEITIYDCDALLNVHRRYGTPVFIDCYNGKDAQNIGTIAKEFNQMKFVMLGMGGEDYKTAVNIAKKSVNIYLETGGSLDPYKIKYACENLGSHRLLYGSHLPYIDGSVFKSLIENAGIDDLEIKDIYYNSAKRLFNWK